MEDSNTERHWLRVRTKAYIAGTLYLSAEEHGVYLLLLMWSSRSPHGELPDDDQALARVARVSVRKWRKIKPTIFAFWGQTARGTWVPATDHVVS